MATEWGDEMIQYKTKGVHISRVNAGDVVEHNGHLVTVGKGDIKSGFCGLTLFGDSYSLGARPVMLATIKTAAI